LEISNFFEEVKIPVLCPRCKNENSFSLIQVESDDYLICRHCCNRIDVRENLKRH